MINLSHKTTPYTLHIQILPIPTFHWYPVLSQLKDNGEWNTYVHNNIIYMVHLCLSVCILPDIVVSRVMLVGSFSYFSFLVLDSSSLNFDQIIFEGVYALHPDIRISLDLWIAVVSMSFHPSWRPYSISYRFYLFLAGAKRAYEITSLVDFLIWNR